MPAVFHYCVKMWGELFEMCAAMWHHFRSKDSDNTGIFLDQPIEFYWNNATNLHHLTIHSTTCCPTT